MTAGFVILACKMKEVLPFRDAGDPNPNVSGVRGRLKLGSPESVVQFEGEVLSVGRACHTQYGPPLDKK